MAVGLLAAGVLGAEDWPTAVKRVWLIPTSSEGVAGEQIAETHAVSFETGVVVSDHAYMKPRRLELEGAVGDVWLYGKDQNGNTVEDTFRSDASRAAAAFAYLASLQARAEPFSVQTGLRLYTNLVITSLTADQDAETAAILVFKASLREVIRVSTRTVTYPPRKPGKPKLQAAPTVAAGEAQSTPADANACNGAVSSCAPPEVKKSVLLKVGTFADLKKLADDSLPKLTAFGGG